MTESAKPRYCVVKRNGRLWVRDDEWDDLIYTPPNFLRDKITSRDQLQVICDRLESGDHYVDVISDFETSLRPDRGPGFRRISEEIRDLYAIEPTE